MRKMRAVHVARPKAPFEIVERDIPEPPAGHVRITVQACGICHSDTLTKDGTFPGIQYPRVPGHEVVGMIDAVGANVAAWAPGQRVGVGWHGGQCGYCSSCRRGDFFACETATRITGITADGGYAEYMTVPAAYAHRLPPGYTNEELAPLLCAGIIGYRALQRAELPDHGRLGIYGFGGSAHLAAQVALARGATVHVLTRGEQAKQLARELGAASVGDADGMPPEPLDAAILFAPVGDLVLPAMAALDRGGTLSIAGIHLTDIPPLNYEKHLFQERQLRSVTSNTRQDARDFLTFAAEHKLAVTVHPYPLDAADQALRDLEAGRFDGAAVLVP